MNPFRSSLVSYALHNHFGMVEETWTTGEKLLAPRSSENNVVEGQVPVLALGAGLLEGIPRESPGDVRRSDGSRRARLAGRHPGRAARRDAALVVVVVVGLLSWFLKRSSFLASYFHARLDTSRRGSHRGSRLDYDPIANRFTIKKREKKKILE